MICPEKIRLPKKLAIQAGEIVRAFSALRELPDRKARLESLHPVIDDPANYSVLMSYDFHVDAAENLRLVEINTNASMSLPTHALYEAHELENPFSRDFRREIIDCFFAEYQLARGASAEKPASVVIVDQDPPSQRLYLEFEMYRELFVRDGLRALISDVKDLSFVNGVIKARGESFDLVYNRDTDFYFETAPSMALNSAMRERAACITPHPHEYRLLADKERLLELARPGAIDSLALTTEQKNALGKTIIASRDLSDFASPDELWAERKRWFFKPKRSYGGKAAYRGSSISRHVFAEIMTAGGYVAQEFVPAPELHLVLPDDDFKYDLRFFAYRDRIQLACARMYKGQMTNSQTPGGGIAAVEWI